MRRRDLRVPFRLIALVSRNSPVARERTNTFAGLVLDAVRQEHLPLPIRQFQFVTESSLKRQERFLSQRCPPHVAEIASRVLSFV